MLRARRLGFLEILAEVLGTGPHRCRNLRYFNVSDDPWPMWRGYPTPHDCANRWLRSRLPGGKVARRWPVDA